MVEAKPRILVLINPRASRAEASLPALSQRLKQHSGVTILTDKEQWKQALRVDGNEHDLIVIGGGDGTISKTLPDLLALKKPFAVLPLGTANDFARTIGLPEDPNAALDVALHGTHRPIDVGLVNGEPYLNVASVGLATKVAREQSKTLKGRWGIFAYAIGLVKAIRDFQPFFVELAIDGEPAWSGLVYQVSVGNGRYHGGGLSVAEHAAIDDGKLDLYLVYPGGIWQLIACITHLKFGLWRPNVLEKLSATAVSLRAWRRHEVDADGELVTETPAEFSLLRHALMVMAPRPQ